MPNLDSSKAHWLLVGDITSPHFRDVYEELQSSVAGDEPSNGPLLQSVGTLTAAIELLSQSAATPDRVLVYQSFPYEFSADDVEVLIGRLPLARWVICFSPWCESLGRSEQIWPIGWCVPLRGAIAKIRQTQAAHQSEVAPLPPTASRDEAFASSVQALWRQPCGAFSFRVTGDDRAAECVIRNLLEQLGGESVSIGEAEWHVALVGLLPANLQASRSTSLELVRDWQQQSGSSARLVVVSDLLTPDQRSYLLSLGVTNCISTLRFAEEFLAMTCPIREIPG